MATRGRDLTINILTDTKKFDLGKPAKDLEKLGTESASAGKALTNLEGDAAHAASGIDKTGKALSDLDREAAQAASGLEKLGREQAGRALTELEGDAKKATSGLEKLDREVKNNKLDQLGKDAKATAKKVDDAFDSMGKSAHTNMDKVDHETSHGMHEAGHATAEFKDEAKQNLSEVASSFQGNMTSVTDLVQGTLGGLVSSLGPVGLALGAAGAIGVGLITKAFGDSAQAAADSKAAITGWFDAIEAGSGKIDNAGIGDKLKEIFADSDKFDELSDKARKTGIDISLLGRALSGDATAAADVRAAMTETARSIARNASDTSISTATQVENQKALEDTAASQKTVNDEINKATRQQSGYQAALAATNAAHSSGADAEAAHQLATDSLTASQDAATQAEADRQTGLATLQTAIAAVGHEEIVRKDGTVKSIDEIIAAQDREIAAKRDFEKNTKAVFKAVGQAGVAWANAQGPNAARAMEELAKAPKSKQKEVVANYVTIGAQAGAGVAAGLTNSKPKVISAVDNLHASAAAELAALDKLGIKIGVDGANLSYEAQLAIMNLQAYFDRHPVTLTVRPGTRPVQG